MKGVNGNENFRAFHSHPLDRGTVAGLAAHQTPYQKVKKVGHLEKSRCLIFYISTRKEGNK